MSENRHYALAREAILAALTAYTGITTADGATPANNTLICSDLINKNDFISNKTILIGSGDAAYEDSGASSFIAATGEITVVSAFSAQIKAGTIFRVLNISTIEVDVEAINTKIGTNVDAAGTTTVFARLRQIVDTYLASGTSGLAALKTFLGTHDTDIKALLATITGYIDTEIAAIEAKLDAQKGATGIFHEQADAAVNINAILASETNVLNLAVANTRYIVRSLRLKCANPGANTVSVRLYELVNDVLINVDTFAITGANFGLYHSLMDMFGLPYLAGDNLQVTVQVSAGVAVAVTAQYSHGKTNV